MISMQLTRDISINSSKIFFVINNLLSKVISILGIKMSIKHIYPAGIWLVNDYQNLLKSYWSKESFDNQIISIYGTFNKSFRGNFPKVSFDNQSLDFKILAG